MELVCFQGNDKENYPQLNALIKRGEWDKVAIIKSKEVEEFISGDNIKVLEINSKASISELKEEIKQKLKSHLSKEFEVALSIASGTGKEHMAVISALLSIPVGIKLTVYTKNGVEFIN